MSDKQQGETIVIVARFINEQQNYYDGHVLLLKEGATRILYLRTFLLSISWTSRVMPNMRTYQGISSWPTCPIRNFSKIKKLLIEGSSFTPIRKKVAYVWSELLITAGWIDCCYAYWSTNAGCSVQRCVLHHLWEMHTRSPFGVVSPLSLEEKAMKYSSLTRRIDDCPSQKAVVAISWE